MKNLVINNETKDESNGPLYLALSLVMELMLDYVILFYFIAFSSQLI